MNKHELIIKTDIDNRPIFEVAGFKTLYASGSGTQITFLEPDILIDKFDAELLIDNLKLNPYWQVGESIGSIYRLNKFKIEDINYKGLLVFNVKPVVDDMFCNIILGCGFKFRSLSYTRGIWKFQLSDNVDEVVSLANESLSQFL